MSKSSREALPATSTKHGELCAIAVLEYRIVDFEETRPACKRSSASAGHRWEVAVLYLQATGRGLEVVARADASVIRIVEDHREIINVTTDRTRCSACKTSGFEHC